MPYILERQVPKINPRPRDPQRLSNIPRPIKQLVLDNNNGINHASKHTVDKLPLQTPSKHKTKAITKAPDERPQQGPAVPLDPNPELAVLELVPFGQQPIVNFGQISLGETRVKYIVLRNTLNKQQQLFVRSFPKAEKGFYMDATEFLIAPRTEICVALACTPKLVGSFRETITLQDSHRMAMKVILLGAGIRPKREASVVRSAYKASVPRIFKRSPNKARRLLMPEQNKKTMTKPITKLQSPSPTKRHQIVRQALARYDNQMAVRIQSYWRMILEQRRIKKLNEAAIVLQSHARALCARRKYQNVRKATIDIQRHYRGMVARREKERLLADLRLRNQMATQIQSYWRMILEQRRIKKLNHAAVILQSHIRALCARRKYQRVRKAIIDIQRYHRGMLARRKKEQLLRIRMATRIQSHWRMVLEQRKLKKTRDAAILIQSHIKALIAMRKYQAVRKATIDIQRHYRGMVARREKERLLQIRMATLIQSYWRMILEQRRIKKLSEATIILQSHIRALIARRKYQKTRKAIIDIQRHYRGMLARRERERLLRIRMVTRIQSHWRMALEQQKIKKIRDAATLIQNRLRALEFLSKAILNTDTASL